MIIFDSILFLAAVLAGGIASLAGFGIGSLLTPLLAVKTGASLAIAAVSIAHFLGTALRLWIWRQYINKRVLFSFGITSAVGGLIGALLHNVFQNEILTVIFGSLLVFAGLSGLTGLSQQWRLKGAAAWMAGALSGLFGGLVGNQGGIRSASMMGFDLSPKEYVATATGIALAVDVARMPVYLAMQWKDILSIWPMVLVMSAGVLVGTELGVRILRRIPEAVFKRVVSGIILLIGIFVLIHR